MEEKILEILKCINEDILTYDGNSMIVDGIINSFEIIEIVAEIEEKFDIEIDTENLIAENFENKDTIIKMAKKFLKL